MYVEPVETNLEIKNVMESYTFRGKYGIYILDKNGKLYDDAYNFIIHEKDEPIFKYKKFNNIYDGNCLYATDDKYLYKLDNAH